MAFNGRELTVDWDATTLVGIRSRGLSGSAEAVDVTTDDSLGFRTLLAEPGVVSAEISVAGITNDETLIAAMYTATVAGRTLTEATVNLPSALAVPGTIVFDAFISAFEITGEHDGSVEFTATLMSSGSIAYTASAAS